MMSLTNTVTSAVVVGAIWGAALARPAAQDEAVQRRNAAKVAMPAPVPWDLPVVSTWKPTLRKDGQPDIEGIYQGVTNEGGGSGSSLEPLPNSMNSGRTAQGMVRDTPNGMVPYLPWARVRRDEVQDHHLHPNAGQVDTRNRGWPDGVPRINYYFVNPMQILQTPGAVVMLYESQHEFRYIPLDGRPQIDNGVKLWMGSSRGRWENGNTLVVDVSNISDRVRFSIAGDFASEDVKVTERWTWVDRDTIRHTATFVDPKVFARPFTVGMTIKRLKEPGFELMEYSGVEGEKDQHLMVDIPATKKEQDNK